ncbi:MAG: EF-hand domain-containing protein [Pseudomonadota bacterium]
MKNLVIATTAILMAAPVVIVSTYAQSELAEVDVDGSGTVSFAEASAVITGLTEDMYAAADTDQDGELSADEYAAMVATITQ